MSAQSISAESMRKSKKSKEQIFYPGFGAGCCMSLFNSAREQIKEAITNNVSVVREIIIQRLQSR